MIFDEKTARRFLIHFLAHLVLLVTQQQRLVGASFNVTAKKSIVVNDRLRVNGDNSGDSYDTLRIIRAYATSIYLQCPLQSKLTNEVISIHQIRWIDEISDFNKPDSAVIVSGHNLITSAQVNLQLNERITYVSCGMYSNAIRIKLDSRSDSVDNKNYYFQRITLRVRA